MSRRSWPDLNLIGFLQSDKGLGQIARGFASALSSLAVSFKSYDISDMEPRSRKNVVRDFSGSDPGSINLVVVNPFELEWIEEKFGPELLRDRYNIGCWWWEVSGPPPVGWRTQLCKFDEIWVGSSFVQETIEKYFDVPVFHIPPVIDLPDGSRFDRAHFGFSETEYIFLFVCDFYSVPERKNPIELVQAFRKAFSSSDPVRLVVKISSGDARPGFMTALKTACAGARVSLIEDRWNRSEISSLMKLCDCYVSIHRAEGFGLTMAEAMLSGTPVVATGWSGNLDFMTEENSFLVPYKLEELKENIDPYQKGHLWAQPDLERCAELLRFVYENRAEAERRGQLGRQTIEQLYSVETVASSIDKRLGELNAITRAVSRILARARDDDKPAAGPIEQVTVAIARGSVIDRPIAIPTVSVCLPIFNGETFLPEGIESVLNQSFVDFELLISDDCSTDSSLSIAQDYARHDNRIRVWRNDRRLGLFANYNQCLRQARGEYIKPFAQDDVLDPRMLQEFMNVFVEHPTVALAGARKNWINELGVSFVPKEFESLESSALTPAVVTSRRDVIGRCFFPVVNLIGEPSTVMFPRRLAGNGFDESYHHVGDLEYWLRLLQHGDFYLAEPLLCGYRVHGQNATAKNVQSLLFAADTLRLWTSSAEILESLGHTYEEFLKDAIECLGYAVLNLTERDLHSGAAAINAIPNLNPGHLHELAFRALRMVGSLSAKDKLSAEELKRIRGIEARIAEIESEVRQLLSSKSWTLTRPLRELQRAVSLAEKEKDEMIFANGWDSPGFAQEVYLLHLSSLKSAIKRSRSWRLTDPLRRAGVL